MAGNPEGDLGLPLPDPLIDSDNVGSTQPPVPEPGLDEQLQQAPVNPEPVVPQAPRHAQWCNPPVEVPPAECLHQEGAGQNCHWQKDNAEAEGSNRPSQVDARMCQDGSRNPPLPVELENENDGEPDKVNTLMIDFILNAAQYKSGVPQNRCEAMNSPNASQWRAAEKAEYDSLMENKTWVLMPRPKDKPIVSC